MRRFDLAGIAIASLLLTASPVRSQTSPQDYVKLAPGDPAAEIVVTAPPKIEPKVVQKQARAVTRMEDFFTAPLAQFEDPVCPGIVGMPTDVASLMIDRFRYDAERIGIPIAKGVTCRPNILIAFVTRGQAGIKLLERKRGYLFAGITMAEMKELANDPGPVHAWSNTAVRSRDGDLIRGSEDAGQIPTVNAPMADSHIFLATRLDIVSSVVIIDVTAINGLSVDQIADYAAMRSLARTRPATGNAALGTILSLFEPGGRSIPGLTAFDIGYLKSVYGGLANLPASAKIGAVPAGIRKAASDLSQESNGQP